MFEVINCNKNGFSIESAILLSFLKYENKRNNESDQNENLSEGLCHETDFLKGLYIIINMYDRSVHALMVFTIFCFLVDEKIPTQIVGHFKEANKKLIIV